jgi:hypothetical protein
MAGSKKSGSKHEYNITGPAAIYSGEFRESQVTTNIGMPAALEQLDEELARIRQRLERDGYRNVTPAGRDRVLKAVNGLQDDLPSLRENRRTLRARVRALIDLLAPVAEIIGGVAALEVILQHL